MKSPVMTFDATAYEFKMYSKHKDKQEPLRIITIITIKTILNYVIFCLILKKNKTIISKKTIVYHFGALYKILSILSIQFSFGIRGGAVPNYFECESQNRDFAARLRLLHM